MTKSEGLSRGCGRCAVTDIKRVLALDPCDSGRDWILARPDRTAYSLWRECQSGSDLIWLSMRTGVDRGLCVRALVACVQPAVERRWAVGTAPRECLRITLAWCDGEASIEEVRAADAATSTAWLGLDLDADLLQHAARAAADAAWAAWAAASHTAARAASAARATAYAAASGVSQARSARIIRRMIPWRLVRDALRAQEVSRG